MKLKKTIKEIRNMARLKETPEMLAARRARDAERKKQFRIIQFLTETNEETDARRILEREKSKKYRELRKSGQGPVTVRVYQDTTKRHWKIQRSILIDLTATDEVVAHRARDAERKRRSRIDELATETEEQADARRARDREKCRRYRHRKRDKMKPKCKVDLNVNDKSPKQLLGSLNTVSNKDMFKDVDADEIAEYKKLFPNLEDIVERRVHCTSCNLHIGTAPINETIIKMHPVLRVIQCKKCYTFYSSGEFECAYDGSEYYCRWCGQGGEVYCCATCPKVYCRRCLVQNLSGETVVDIENNEAWICFVCEPACTIQLRADYWALLNFIEKQKKEISDKSLTENELYEAMSNDRSICCPNIRHRKNFKRKLSSSLDSTIPAKRTDTEPPISDPQKVIIDALAKVEKIKNPIISKENSFQCLSDIRNTIICDDSESSSDDTINEMKSPHIEPLKLISVEDQLQAENSIDRSIFHTISGFRIDLNEASQQGYYRLPNGKLIQVKKLPAKSKDVNVPISEDSMNNTQMLIPPALVPPTENSPFIDPAMNSSIVNIPILIGPSINSPIVNNETLQHPTMSSSNITPPTTNHLIISSSSQISDGMIIVPTPLNSMSSTTISPPLLNISPPPLVFSFPFNPIQPTISLQPSQMKQIQLILKVQQPTVELSTVPMLVQLNRNSDVPEPQPSQPPENQIHIRSVSTVPANIINSTDPSILEPIHSSDTHITSLFTDSALSETEQNLNTEDSIHSQSSDSDIRITSLSTGQANLSLDEAKAQFEIRVDDSIEVCEHIVGKMKLLTNSTAFKRVESIADVRDLIMHLSYLLTYAGSRFKFLQDKCDEDMKLIGFDSDDLKSNNDEIEVLEPILTLIDLDSDENDSETEITKAVNNFEFVDITEIEDNQLMTNDVSQIEIDTNSMLISDYTDKDVTHSTEIMAEAGESSIHEAVNRFSNGAKPKKKNGRRVKNIEESQTSKEIIQDEIANLSSETYSDITINVCIVTKL